MTRIYIDSKCTIWNRASVEVPDDVIDTIKEAIKNGTYRDDMLSEYAPEYCNIEETIENMNPDENGGCSTIEMYDTKDTLLSDNGTFK